MDKFKCPHCAGTISSEELAKFLASKGGQSHSKKKSEASRENGKKGGRPRKQKPASAEAKL